MSDDINEVIRRIEREKRKKYRKELKEKYRKESEKQEGTKHKERLDAPEEIYNKSMNAIGKLWTKLFNYKDLPGPKTDIDSKVITPSQKHMLRLLKGLNPEERSALISQISQMHIAYVGFLKHARDVLAEENSGGGVEK